MVAALQGFGTNHNQSNQCVSHFAHREVADCFINSSLMAAITESIIITGLEIPSLKIRVRSSFKTIQRGTDGSHYPFGNLATTSERQNPILKFAAK
jgi:cobalamin biosynthesis Co2+ chelatase CbiK